MRKAQFFLWYAEETKAQKGNMAYPRLWSYKCLSKLELRSNETDKRRGEFQHANERGAHTQECPVSFVARVSESFAGRGV